MINTTVRQGCYASVWGTELSKTGNTTRVRLSVSRKNKMTGEYEQDFSGFCTFIGNAHKMAAALKERDRIKILECDVSTTYDKEKKVEYVNYKVFDFEMADGGKPNVDATVAQPAKKTAALLEGDTGVEDDDDIPF